MCRGEGYVLFQTMGRTGRQSLMAANGANSRAPETPNENDVTHSHLGRGSARPPRLPAQVRLLAARHRPFWARRIGKLPASDLDFNDLTYWVCGLSYGYGPEFSFIPPSGYSEQPFPQPAWYANFGIALDNEVSFAFRSSQTSGHDSAWISQNAEPWQFVGPGYHAGDRAGGPHRLRDSGRRSSRSSRIQRKNADRLGYFVALFAGNRAHGAHRDAGTCDVRASPCSRLCSGFPVRYR